MTASSPVKLMGAPGSPYTRKLLAVLRYRHIPHRMLWGSHGFISSGHEDLPEPKVRLLPTVYLPDETGKVQAEVDTTPLIRRFEREYDGRSVIPSDPVLGFLNYLIEDYADEWLTKPMFHYRWAHEEDIANARKILIYWQNPAMTDEQADALGQQVGDRQIERLYVVGSNEETGELIEEKFISFLKVLDQLLMAQGYVLGTRPSSADFAIYGQMTQLGIVDPTPARLTNRLTPRVRGWIDRMDDLSGLMPEDTDWLSTDAAKEMLQPLLKEIGSAYTPVMLANAQAVMAGEKNFETAIDGRTWRQPTFPYQARCLHWLREAFSALDDTAQGTVRDILTETGCEPLLT